MAELTPGGNFLITEVGQDRFLIPEHFDEETRMVGDTTQQFLEQEVLPRAEEIERKDYDLLRSLLRKAGELGLLGLQIPEQYGGLGASKAMTMHVSERNAGLGSWIVTFGAHTGIGTLPIVYFGTPEQKAKYLPKSATAEWVFAYALTEPTSGSDALGAKTRAELSPDGKYYILNGTKQFITNAGFADVFVVFAKVDGEHFTAFIVERGFEGVSIGPEEHKMGIRGSSTCQLILENAKVPVENLLGEVGKGHRIAFNILNVGRFKLAVGTVGAAKRILRETYQYAAERKQFGVPIATFGVLRRKLARMAVYAYVAESQMYRVAGYMDAAHPADDDVAEQLRVLQEYAVEDSIMKVFGSETLDFVVDEAVQIHGGYGYIEEYPVERAYRDSRINRIFEGTNEINRLLVPGMLLKAAMKGKLPLLQLAQEVTAEIEGEGPLSVPPGDPNWDRLRYYTEAIKRVAIYLTAQAVQRYMNALENEQELLEDLADIVIEAYALDCAVGRALMVREEDVARGDKQILMARAYLPEALERVRRSVRRILPRVTDEPEARWQRLAGLLAEPVQDLVGIHREIADLVAEAEGYPL